MAADLAEQMQGKVWRHDRAAPLVDEISRAYKDIEQVMADQADLVRVDKTCPRSSTTRDRPVGRRRRYLGRVNNEPTGAAREHEDQGDPGVVADQPPEEIADHDKREPGDEIATREHNGSEPDGAGADGADDGDDADDREEGTEVSTDEYSGRRNALPRRVETWRSRSATGAIATALAMGLQQVFEPERRRPAAVAEAPSDPYDDTDPVTVEYVPDDAEATKVRVKPWLLAKDDPL